MKIFTNLRSWPDLEALQIGPTKFAFHPSCYYASLVFEVVYSAPIAEDVVKYTYRRDEGLVA